MRKRYCYHCGKVFYGRKIFINPMREIDSIYCSDKCDEEATHLDVSEDVGLLEPEPDQYTNPTNMPSSPSNNSPQYVQTVNCWYCKKILSRLPQFADPPYGHKCQSCGHSLRDNPSYGEGASLDCVRKRAYAVSY